MFQGVDANFSSLEVEAGKQNNADNKVVARYSINGQLLDAPQKGINILKYADGRIEKVIVK